MSVGVGIGAALDAMNRKKGNDASKTDENDSAETDGTKDEEQN